VGNCAHCNKSRKAFKSLPAGRRIPPYLTAIDLPFKSNKNSHLCNGCYLKLYRFNEKLQSTVTKGALSSNDLLNKQITLY